MNEPRATDAPIIDVRGVTKAFEHGRIPALTGVDLAIQPGEFVALVGPSGCGKSTLLHLIAALDRQDEGTIRVAGHDLTNDRDLNHFRTHDVGIIFQLHNLIPTLTASENVQLPMIAAGHSGHDRREQARRLLTLVGLEGKERQRPAALSGGERQRVAVARALANDPPILLADEPTGNLDSDAGLRVLGLLEDLRTQRGLTILIVTHDAEVATHADRTVRMRDGKIVDQGRAEPPTNSILSSDQPVVRLVADSLVGSHATTGSPG